MKLVGERRALASAVMAFYFLFYGVLALTRVAPDLTKAFAAIAGVYGLAFFSLVAGYFWARWYAVGVGLFGVIFAAVGLWQLGPEPMIVFMGVTHMAATLFLWGETMSEPYDGQTAWREKFHMDDHAVQRLGRSVIRAGVSLPFILMYALLPRQGSVATTLIGSTVFLLAAFGLRGLIRLRTWGIFAIGAAGALSLGMVGMDLVLHRFDAFTIGPAIAAGALFSAVVPFLAPIARFWLQRSVPR